MILLFVLAIIVVVVTGILAVLKGLWEALKLVACAFVVFVVLAIILLGGCIII